MGGDRRAGRDAGAVLGHRGEVAEGGQQPFAEGPHRLRFLGVVLLRRLGDGPYDDQGPLPARLLGVRTGPFGRGGRLRQQLLDLLGTSGQGGDELLEVRIGGRGAA